MKLYIDLETIPSNKPQFKLFEVKKAAEKIKEPAITKTGKIKSEADLAAWRENEYPQLLEDAVKDAIAAHGLDGAFGEICTIGFQFDDCSPVVLQRTGYDDSEKRLIMDFLDAVHSYRNDAYGRSTVEMQWIAFNGIDFDIPFLHQRCLINRIIPNSIRIPVDAKPWESGVFDPMKKWAGLRNRISFERLCLAFGIECKGEMSGADVFPAWKAGEYEKIAAYCLSDIEALVKLHKAMTYDY